MTRSVFNHRRATQLALCSDTFNRTDSTTNLGSTDGLVVPGTLDPLTWTQDASGRFGGTPPGFGILSNQAYTPAGTGKPRQPIAVVDVLAADVDILLTIATNSNQSGIIFRFSDNQNFWYALNRSTEPGIYIIKRVAGTETTVYHLGSTGFSSGDVMRITAVGSTINFYRNTTLETTQTDSFNSTATQQGMFTVNEFTAGNGGDAGVRLNDFVVYGA